MSSISTSRIKINVALAAVFVAASFVALSTFAVNTVSAATSVCPFCSAVNMTFTEQIKSNDVVVVARLTKLPPIVDDPDAELPKAEFVVTSVIKGQEFVAEEMEFKTLLVGRYDEGEQFLIMGVEPPRVSWSTPMRASDRVFKYLNDIQELPKDGADRLAFFQNYFEDEESVLAFDAFDEFAAASYEDLIALKPRMDRPQLLAWIKDPETSVDRRRLYFTMLGVCGKDEDTEILEGFIKSGDRKKQAGLDALVACYLALKGDAGVDLIEESFLKGTEPDYVDTLSAISALRFHATELKVVSRDRIVKAVRNLLDRPKMADMIIPDLARWEDWTVMDRLVKMFKEADEETNWLRVPVITYLRACPKPEAKKYIEELSKIDPDAVKRADFFLDFDDEDEDEGEEAEDEDSVDDSSESAVEEPEKKESAPVGGGLSQAELSGLKDTLPVSRTGETYVAKRIPLDDSLVIMTDSIESAEHLNSDDSGNVDQAGDNKLAPESETTETFASGGVTPPTMATPVVEGLLDADQVALAPQPAPVAAIQTDYNLTTRVIFLPMAASFLIFLLLWCVINGWFERLIF